MRANTRRSRVRRPAQRTSFGSTLGVLTVVAVLFTILLIVSNNTDLI